MDFFSCQTEKVKGLRIQRYSAVGLVAKFSEDGKEIILTVLL